MLARHGGLNDNLLQGPAVLPRRLGPEIVKAEPAGQFPAGVVPLPAPLAVGARAGGVPQPLRSSRPAPGNWWRTQGGMTELPPATDSHARA